MRALYIGLAGLLTFATVLVFHPQANRAQVVGTFVQGGAAAPSCTGYTGPADITPFYLFYGLRAASCANAAAGVNLLDWTCDSGGHTGTVKAITSGGTKGQADLSTITCTDATPLVSKIYNQGTAGTGGSNPDYVPAATTTLPLVVSCTNSLPCVNNTTGATGQQLHSNNAVSSGAQPFSNYGIALKHVGSSSTIDIINLDFSAFTGGDLEFAVAANSQIEAYSGTALTSSNTPTRDVFYSAFALFNGASSAVWLNGTQTTGNAGAGTTSGKTVGTFTNGGNGEITEVGMMKSDVTSNEAALRSNACTYWTGSATC